MTYIAILLLAIIASAAGYLWRPGREKKEFYEEESLELYNEHKPAFQAQNLTLKDFDKSLNMMMNQLDNHVLVRNFLKNNGLSDEADALIAMQTARARFYKILSIVTGAELTDLKRSSLAQYSFGVYWPKILRAFEITKREGVYVDQQEKALRHEIV